MDVYRGPQTVVHRRFRDLQPYLDELKEEGLRPVKSPRFKVLMKHPERDDWAAVVKNRAGEFVLVRGGLDFMSGPPQKERRERRVVSMASD